MGELGGRGSGRRVPRFRTATGLIVSALILFVPALPPAATAADDVAQGTAGDNAAPAAGPPPGAPDNAAAARDAISRAIKSFEKEIRDAYHRALVKQPKINGEITVSFVVRPDGDVIDVKVEKSTLDWPPLEAEIVNRIGTWKFPPFRGEPIPATVPYRFGPG